MMGGKKSEGKGNECSPVSEGIQHGTTLREKEQQMSRRACTLGTGRRERIKGKRAGCGAAQTAQGYASLTCLQEQHAADLTGQEKRNEMGEKPQLNQQTTAKPN